ncbi:DUF2252 domain-containing protein [Brevibacterium ammoniilyticum]|uniref:DUF2252 domain-containing protein n=1 Tax=Brevibacterium ammoniilyticum TaxID=1046555 RepID=A0ABP9TWI5_9MICO
MVATDGKSLREATPRSSQADLDLPADRDPVAVICTQNETRLPELLGIRTQRLAESPFSYYRGAAAQMSSDLNAVRSAGPVVLSCADAHLGNFGFFASRERSLVFDLNDFDEAEYAPFEWDVKRLAASAHLSAQVHGLSEEAGHAAAFASVKGYQERLAALMEQTALDRFYAIVDADTMLRAIEARGRGKDKATAKAMKKARSRTGEKALKKFATETSDSGLRIVDQPPLTEHFDEAGIDVETLFAEYRQTARTDVMMLLRQFSVADSVLRVVGVGSVGTRCFLVLLSGPGEESMLLQVKEAQESVVTAFGGQLPFSDRPEGKIISSEGERVVRAQTVLQSVSDPFLGWNTFNGRDYYWRQFRDMKGSYDLATLDATQLESYSRLCGEVLARAHSQSPEARLVVEYLGNSDTFATAVSEWARKYAEVVTADHAQLVEAAKSGKYPLLGEWAEEG